MGQPTARIIRNPVLAGSHPDPSVLRVGPDFYVAASTFEWYTGVRLHHSRDLVRWRLLGPSLDATVLSGMRTTQPAKAKPSRAKKTVRARRLRPRR